MSDQNNESLKRADEAKSLFLRTVSHDVRSPLTAVLSAAKLLEDDRGLDEAQRQQFVQMIVRNANRIRRLLDDVLDIERLTRGATIEPVLTEVDLEQLVADVIDEINTQKRTITVDCQVKTIVADRMQVERTIYNLVGNALKHTDSDITVCTFAEGDGTTIAVGDHSGGVPDDLKQEIFEPFKRATDGNTPGTGIGLSLVAEFARGHHGRAWVEDNDGGGSSFRVWFPHAEADDF